nr:hypothetical protein [uncultured Sediminibacterium sp.]
MNIKRHKDDFEDGFGWVAAGTSLAIIGAWFFTYFTLKDLDSEARGTFGDMFGSVNAFFQD